jgi:hypothetical protein
VVLPSGTGTTAFFLARALEQQQQQQQWPVGAEVEVLAVPVAAPPADLRRRFAALERAAREGEVEVAVEVEVEAGVGLGAGTGALPALPSDESDGQHASVRRPPRAATASARLPVTLTVLEPRQRRAFGAPHRRLLEAWREVRQCAAGGARATNARPACALPSLTTPFFPNRL